MYLYLFMGLSAFGVVSIYVLNRAVVIALARQSREVHSKMIKGLLYASLSNFFNRVPTGRIMNRLTKDLR